MSGDNYKTNNPNSLKVSTGFEYQNSSKFSISISKSALTLDDIRNSEKIKYVMINGRLYDSATMNEVGTREKLRSKLWFESVKGNGFIIPNSESEAWTLPFHIVIN